MGSTMRVRGVAVAVAVAASLGSLGVAPAAVADVTCDFDELATQTGDATFGGRNADKDEDGLLAKIAAAETKFSVAKAIDADGKLADYQAKVEQLRAAGKLVESEAVALLDLAAQTRECVLPTS